MYKVGNSIDIHKLTKGKPLYVGGVLIPSDFGGESYTDGDALTHCIAEAILGALNKGDLGHNFPDTDPTYKNMRSTEILKKVSHIMHNDGYCIGNIDTMIVLEKPKLSPYIEQIKQSIASILEIETNKISIKAGTNEKIGEIGNSESYLSWASVFLSKAED